MCARSWARPWFGVTPGAGAGGTTIPSTSRVIATAITPSENDSSRLVATGVPFVGRGVDPTMDKPGRPRETALMLAAGSVRQSLARTLNAAYSDGLLSEGTFAHRLD